MHGLNGGSVSIWMFYNRVLCSSWIDRGSRVCEGVTWLVLFLYFEVYSIF